MRNSKINTAFSIVEAIVVALIIVGWFSNSFSFLIHLGQIEVYPFPCEIKLINESSLKTKNGDTLICSSNNTIKVLGFTKDGMLLAEEAYCDDEWITVNGRIDISNVENKQEMQEEYRIIKERQKSGFQEYLRGTIIDLSISMAISLIIMLVLSRFLGDKRIIHILILVGLIIIGIITIGHTIIMR